MDPPVGPAQPQSILGIDLGIRKCLLQILINGVQRARRPVKLVFHYRVTGVAVDDRRQRPSLFVQELKDERDTERSIAP